MPLPNTLLNQQVGKAEVALYVRGAGRLPAQQHPCPLQPPPPLANPYAIDLIDAYSNNWSGPHQPNWFLSLFTQPLYEGGELRLPHHPYDNTDDLAAINIRQHRDDEFTPALTQQFYRSLSTVTRPFSFEVQGYGAQPRYEIQKVIAALKDKRPVSDGIIGCTEPATRLQFVCHRYEAKGLRNKLQLQYPRSEFVVAGLDENQQQVGQEILNEGTFAASLALSDAVIYPLNAGRYYDADPSLPAIAAMERLGRRQFALLQFLIVPLSSDWPRSLFSVLQHPYKPGELLFDCDEKTFKQKFASPAFALSIRVVASSKSTFRALLAWAAQYNLPPQKLTPLIPTWSDDADSQHERETLAQAVEHRCTFRPGFICNLEEIAALAHLPDPNIAAERISRLAIRTRPTPKAASHQPGLLLGYNPHRGARHPVYLPDNLRAMHTMVFGSSGSGKTTLLKNAAISDMQNGGAAFLCPHGDSISDLLRQIPPHRVKDTIIYDATDHSHVIGLNPLATKTGDPLEKERIVSDVVAAFKKGNLDSWGPRLDHIFRYVIAAVLYIPGGTLMDCKRILLDEDFRQYAISHLADPDLRAFFTAELPAMPKNSIDPLINKVSPYLMASSVRNIVCSPKTLDFDRIINTGQILLCKVPLGLLTATHGILIGSAIVSQIVAAAFRRAKIPEQARKPFALFVDEMSNFTNFGAAVDFERILSELRKYRIRFTGAAQYTDQLGSSVMQAISGNVGAIIAMRLGETDARTLSRNFAEYQPEDLMALDVGQAIVRVFNRNNSCTVNTLPPPVMPKRNPTAQIYAQTRRTYALPKKEVEAAIAASYSIQTPKPEPKKPPGVPPPLPPDFDDFVS